MIAKDPSPPGPSRDTAGAASPPLPHFLAAFLEAQLSAFLKHLPATLEGSDPEALHDLRVAVRRSRSALGQFRQALPREGLARLRRELAWLGKTSGPARDLDVLLAALDELLEGRPEAERAALAPLRAAILDRRRRLQTRLRRALDGPRCRRVVAEWQGYVEAARGAGGEPLGPLAAERIARVAERTLVRSGSLGAGAPDEEIHRLRIQCKKLRYVLELCRPLYAAESMDPILAALRALQDELGAFQDLRVHSKLLEEASIEAAAAGALSPPGLLAAGRLVGELERRRVKARRRVERAVARFRKRGPALLRRLVPATAGQSALRAAPGPPFAPTPT